MSTQTFTTTGTWTAPADVHSVVVECWAGGGSGAADSGERCTGGGGGAYSKKTITNTIVPGTVYTVTVGTGGASRSGTGSPGLVGNDGGESWFSTSGTVLAKPGKGGNLGNTSSGGPGGDSVAGTGDTKFSGGHGGNTTTSNTTAGGGGAGSGGAGGDVATNSTTGGTAGTPDGGAGGSSNNNATGNPGSAPGGGGGSCIVGSGSYSSGAGADGQVKLTWTTDPITRYWVGGTGNWDASSTTNWAYTSGGTSGAFTPTSSNNVFFDANSGSGTVTVTATANCNNLDFTGYTGTFAGSSALNVYGNLTLATGMTNSYTGATSFLSTTSQTITNAGKTINSALTFNGSGGTWTLQDALNSSSSITNTLGTLAFNGKNATATTISNAGVLTTGNGTLSFTTISNTGTITFGNGNLTATTFNNSGTTTFGSGTITLNGTGSVWNNTGTIMIGTSTIKLTDASSSSKTFSGGSQTYNNLWITGSGTGAYTIIGSNTFNDFKIDTPPHTVNFTAGSRQTVSSFTVSGTAGKLNILQSTSTGTQWQLASSNQISIDYVSLQDSDAIKL
jgi:hypothetical protein